MAAAKLLSGRSFPRHSRLVGKPCRSPSALPSQKPVQQNTLSQEMSEQLGGVLRLVAGVTLSGVLVSCFLYSSHRLPGAWGYISDALGVSYTAAWSISFYPQLILNFRRK